MKAASARQFIVVPEKYTFGGEALARLPDGRAVFVPYAVVGEEVRIEVIEEHERYARAQIIEYLRPSPQRISPQCPHFTLCGGCHYQHLTYETQLHLKEAILKEQLTRLGGLETRRIDALFPSPKEYSYRNYVQFHLTPQGSLGFYRSDGQHTFAVEECHLADAALEQARHSLEFDARLELSRIGLRLGDNEDIQIILEGEAQHLPEVTLEEVPYSIVHLSSAGALVMAGSPYVFITVAGRAFRVSAASFFQVNTGACEQMIYHLIDQLEQRGVLSPHATLLEAYCGVGLISAFLAPRVKRLIGVEISPHACDDFAYNLDEFAHVELYTAPVEKMLRYWQDRVDVLLADPPRNGMGKTVIQDVARLQVPLVVYLSCDAATLGRDARLLHQAGYRVTHIALFDFFPQTYHIESLSFWELGAST